MREIKFRGMNIAGDWCFGNLAIIKKDIDQIRKKGWYISNSAGLPFAYQIRPETIGEYTGLKDKNGKKIYEGDIVKNLRYPSIAQVVWEEPNPSKAGIVKGIFGEESDLTGFLHPISQFTFKKVGDGLLKAFYIDELEVIGNIYEHGHLLK